MIGIGFAYSACGQSVLALCIPKKLRKWDAKAKLWVMEKSTWEKGLELSYTTEVMYALRRESHSMADIGNALEAFREARVLENATLPTYEFTGGRSFRQLVRN